MAIHTHTAGFPFDVSTKPRRVDGRDEPGQDGISHPVLDCSPSSQRRMVANALISFKTTKEYLWIFLGKAWFPLETFGYPWTGLQKIWPLSYP